MMSATRRLLEQRAGLICEALPYGRLYVANCQRDGDYISDPDRSARIWADYCAAQAMLRRETIHQVVTRLFPELVAARQDRRAAA